MQCRTIPLKRVFLKYPLASKPFYVVSEEIMPLVNFFDVMSSITSGLVGSLLIVKNSID